MKLRDYWDRYFWLVGLVVLAIFLLVCLYGRAPFCGPDEHCLREWISALSGWIAATGAFLTIGAMLRIQRQNVELQLHRSATLALRVSRRCNNIRISVERLQRALSDETITSLDDDLMKALRRIDENFNDTDFDEFERIVFVGATYLRSVRRALADAVRSFGINRPFKRSWDSAELSAERRTKVDNALARATEHHERLTQAADHFLKKWELKGQ